MALALTEEQQDARYEEIGRKAIIAQHKHIRSFLASRRFDDEGQTRALITEYIKHIAIAEARVTDEEL